jgi:hypothetical protein
MAAIIVPIQQGVPNQRVQFAIAGVAFIFDFRWNAGDVTRSQDQKGWYLDVYDVNEKPIASGLRCVIGTYIGRACQAAPFADGALIVFDTSRKGIDAGLDDFGGRVQMAYLNSGDLLAQFSRLGAK